MVFSMNIHPDEKWVSVEAKLYGAKEGCVIILTFTDTTGKTASPDVHFGSMKYANEFIGMLQDAVNKLPRTCDCCGQTICPKK